MSARTSASSICFGDDTTPTSRPSSRVLRPGGTGGSSRVFGGPDDDEVRKPSSRIIHPGGTGGKSSVFEDEPPKKLPPKEPSPNPLTSPAADATPERLHTRVHMPGGTGGKSQLFEPETEPTVVLAERAVSPAPPFALETEQAGQASRPKVSTRVLRPGGTGGESHIFDTEPEEPATVYSPPTSGKGQVLSSVTESRAMAKDYRRLNREGEGVLFGDDGGSIDPPKHPSRRAISAEHAGGGPSRVFAGEGANAEPAGSGRKVEAGRTNVSQVSLGGGYPDAEPSKRNYRRGNIKTDANRSQISFGDDTGGEPPVPKSGGRTTSRVLRPGGTGGSSQIVFSDDTNGEPVLEKFSSNNPGAVRTSSRVARPGGTGGGSQIQFGDDNNAQPVTQRVTPQGLRDAPVPVGADGKPVAGGAIHTSSRVIKPGGTGGGSQIVFGASDDAPALAQRVTPQGIREAPVPVGADGKPLSGGAVHTSSRVLKPGGTGGTSQITF